MRALRPDDPGLDAANHDWAPRGVSFVGVNSDGGGATVDDIKAFLIEHPFSYPVVRDGDGEVGALYRVEALPTIVVLGRDGRIRDQLRRLHDEGNAREGAARSGRFDALTGATP